MRFGITLPNFGVREDPRILADMAVEAEEAGWEAVFIWDTPYASGDDPAQRVTHEAWAALTTMALRTERVLLGTMITPLPWRQPWLIARQALTLDQLSGGRFVLSVGLGYVEGSKPTAFTEESDRRTRATMLDEGLEVLRGLWSGERFSFEGDHYQVNDVLYLPPPLGKIPVWVVGAWHRDPTTWSKMRSLRRALRWDGVLPNVFDRDGVTFEATPDDLRAMTEWIRAERTEPFDIIWEGGGEKEDVNADAATVTEWRDAGATWWLEAVWWSMYRHAGDPEPMRERIRRGPPKI